MSRRAFTLIELLIVVAIIAILAAIAVPNFLEAQVRAKTSRVRSDMRTVAVAMESYRLDNTAHAPHDRHFGTGTLRINPVAKGQYPLTTPVAYITTTPQDPFFNGRDDLATWGGPVFDY